MQNPNNIPSPCIHVCVRDLGDICMGCYRSIDEIRCWYKFSDEEKIRTIKNAEQRRVKKKKKIMNTRIIFSSITFAFPLIHFYPLP